MAHQFKIFVNGEVVFNSDTEKVTNIELTSNEGALTNFNGEDLYITFDVVEPHDDLTLPPVVLQAERVAAGLSDTMTPEAATEVVSSQEPVAPETVTSTPEGIDTSGNVASGESNQSNSVAEVPSEPTA